MGTCELRLTIPPSIINGANPGLLTSMHARPPLHLPSQFDDTHQPRAHFLRIRGPSASLVSPRSSSIMRRGTDGLVWHRKFQCEEEEILTFELGCGTTALGDSCTVEWWQDREKPNPGEFLLCFARVNIILCRLFKPYSSRNTQLNKGRSLLPCPVELLRRCFICF